MSDSEPAIRNIVLISIDCLRADHLSCYGYPYVTTPYIDALAENGVLFEQCICQIPLTGPSHASMLTACHPITHGAIRNGVPINGLFPPLSLLLQQNGLSTAAFTSAWTLKAHLTGLDVGFAHYDDAVSTRYKVINQKRPSNETIDAAAEWLGSHSADRPFFLFVHLFDPHDPYEARKGFLDLERDDGRSDDRPELIRNYDSEAAAADHEVGRLLQALEEAGARDHTLIIVTGDHGESLGEHRYYGHGRRVSEPVMHVPLVVSHRGGPQGTPLQKRDAGQPPGESDVGADPGVGPDDFAGAHTGAPLQKKDASRIAARVQHIDIFPTILDLLQLEPEQPVQGKSLLPLICGEVDTVHETIYFVTYPGAVGHLPSPLRRWFRRGKPPLPSMLGLYEGDCKCVYMPRKGRVELYDLASDPAEAKNLLADRREAKAYKERLLAWFRDNRGKVKVRKLSKTDKERLKGLGYL